MSKTTISDSRVRLRPSVRLLELIDTHHNEITALPKNIFDALQEAGYDVPCNVEESEKEEITHTQFAIKLLSSLCKSEENDLEIDANKADKEKSCANKDSEKRDNVYKSLTLSDLHWINRFLRRLRRDKNLDVHLHDLLDSCTLLLPDNEVIERNPELEARCQRLREEQQNRDYMRMTKNVDATLKYMPEDTIAYQVKSLNKQIIAVFQFVLSVVAGFVFGFLGIQLIVGNLDFGFRLLLGIMFALIIALAEIYFLAKKLNEYDDIQTVTAAYASTIRSPNSPVKTRKSHMD